MYTVAIIQARLNSQRLPNKILMEIPPGSGVTVLERVLYAAKNAELVDKVIIDIPEDEDGKVGFQGDIEYCLGSSHRDLLEDFYRIARETNTDIIVRLTADCPMLTSEIIDNCVKKFLDSNVDFVYNTSSDDQPYRDGFDVEVFSREALERAYKESQEERQHVTVKFRKGDYTKLRVEPPEGEFYSLDNEEDYQKICSIMNS